MYICRPEVRTQDGRVSYNVRICMEQHPQQDAGRPAEQPKQEQSQQEGAKQEARTLWYSLAEEYADMVSDSSDAALVALLLPAMQEGQDIYLEGSISERLYYHLRGPYQELMQVWMPRLKRIKIHPSDLHVHPANSNGVAAGFSAGVDSYCLLERHYFSPHVPDGFRITHLLFNNVGSHTSSRNVGDTAQLFHKRQQGVSSIVAEFGLPLVIVDSNLDSFYRNLPSCENFSFIDSHTLRNVSVALLLQSGIGRFLYASGQYIGDSSVDPHVPIAALDPIALPMLSSEAMEAFSVDNQFTRVEKTLRVAQVEASYTSLDVCTQLNEGYNCGQCEKCMRTLLTLEIAGYLDRYQAVFDLDAYRKYRDRFLAKLLVQRHKPYNREIIELASQRNYSLQPGPTGYLWGAASLGRQAGAKVKHLLNQ